MDGENLADIYYEKLSTTTNPGLVLAQFYRDVSNKPMTKSEIIMFNKLIKTFGRFIVYFSIVDLANTDIKGNPIALFHTVCKNRLEKKYGIVLNLEESLEKEINRMDKAIKAQETTKLEIPDID
jgi:hypothetical protein